jgi:hypothetical protein
MSAEVAVMANPEYEQLLENLRLLKLGSLVPVLESHLKRAAKGSVSYQDFLAGLVREALQLREQRTREGRLAACRFPFIRRLDEFDWAAQPTLNRAELEPPGQPALHRRPRQRRLPASGRSASSKKRFGPRSPSAVSHSPTTRSTLRVTVGMCGQSARPWDMLVVAALSVQQTVFKPCVFGPLGASFEFRRATSACKSAAKAVGIRLPPGPPANASAGRG